MARIQKPEDVQAAAEAAPQPATEGAAQAVAPATAAAPVPVIPAVAQQAGGGNAIVLATGERRIDYIRRRFAEGAKRGLIAKELGVAYQIVFAATKTKKEGGTAAVAAVGVAAAPVSAPTPAPQPASDAPAAA